MGELEYLKLHLLRRPEFANFCTLVNRQSFAIEPPIYGGLSISPAKACFRKLVEQGYDVIKESVPFEQAKESAHNSHCLERTVEGVLVRNSDSRRVCASFDDVLGFSNDNIAVVEAVEHGKLDEKYFQNLAARLGVLRTWHHGRRVGCMLLMPPYSGAPSAVLEEFKQNKGYITFMRFLYRAEKKPAEKDITPVPYPSPQENLHYNKSDVKQD